MNFLKFGESLTTLIGIELIFYNMCIIRIFFGNSKHEFIIVNKFKTVDAIIFK